MKEGREEGRPEPWGAKSLKTNGFGFAWIDFGPVLRFQLGTLQT
jgi:hypothetical protein